MFLETSDSFMYLTRMMMMRTEMFLKTSVSFIHLTRMMMMRTEMVFETSVSFIHLTRLLAREDFIESCHRESFRSYDINIVAIRTKSM
jgi:hypothetical protein